MNQQIINNCKYLLESRPKLRELVNSREAIWTYFEEFCGIRDHLTRTDFLSARVPNFETLTSAFRTVKRKYPNLRGSLASQQMQRDRSKQFQHQFGYPTH